jgi:plasmid stability protein
MCNEFEKQLTERIRVAKHYVSVEREKNRILEFEIKELQADIQQIDDALAFEERRLREIEQTEKRLTERLKNLLTGRK